MEYKYCSICGKKIGFLRRMFARRLDKDPVHMIPLAQFCSGKCADKGLNSMLKDLNDKKKTM